MYDIIIGLETLSDWRMILDFHDKTVTIDHVELPMKSLQRLRNQKVLDNLYQEVTEPAISRVGTNQVIQILDAKYEKANSLKVAEENSRHLNVQKRNDLLWLLIQHEDLFDGTLGDW